MTVLLERPDLISALTLAARPGAPRRPGEHAGISHPHAPGLEIVGADSTVPLVGGGRITYANLDHGASAPALRGGEGRRRSAADAATRACTAAPAGTPGCARSCTRAPASPVRDFVGGRSDDAVIFTRQHHGLVQPARALPAGPHHRGRVRDRAPRRAAAVAGRSGRSGCRRPDARRRGGRGRRRAAAPPARAARCW